MNEPQLPRKSEERIVTVRGRQQIAGGRWSHELVYQWLMENARDKYQDIGDLARFACGSKTKPTIKRARGRLSGLFNVFLDHGQFLAVHYDKNNHNAAISVKVADVSKQEDFDNVLAKLDRMRKHKELSEETYRRTVALLDAAKGETQA
jgi:hypothetical protein